MFGMLFTISCQKIQICERTLKFSWLFLCGPNEFATFCVGFSSRKKSSLKKILKKLKFEVAEKSVFLLFYAQKIRNLINFVYYLEEKGLNYKESTENKPKIWFLIP